MTKGPRLVVLNSIFLASWLEPNQTVIAALKAEGLPVRAIETPGHHQWPVWRDNLIHFAPLLFQK